ncbi:MAG: rod shape-determining protein RodA [Bacteroidota bacterium]
MVKRSNGIFGEFDFPLFIVFILLLFFGWFNIYSASLNLDHLSIFDSSQEYGKQFIWICVSIGIGFFIMLLDGGIFKTLSIPFYGFTILLLIAVLLFGKKVNGATSWFGFGSFGIQPSEFAKLGLALVIANFISDGFPFSQKIDFSIFGIRIHFSTDLLALLGLIGLPALLIVLQPDPGTMLVFLAFMLVLYRGGFLETPLYMGLLAIIIGVLTLLFIHSSVDILSLEVHGLFFLILGIVLFVILSIYFFNYFTPPRFRTQMVKNAIATGILAVLIMGCTYFVYHSERFLNSKEELVLAEESPDEVKLTSILKKHHKQRIDVLFGHKKDIHDIGYNVHQSKIAIGSGGIKGKGFTDGTLTKFKYVPMQSTDFIFCTIGEEWGYLGSALVVILFLFMLFRIIIIAERQRSVFTRMFAYSVAGIFFIHFTINIGMTIGLCPVIGIPLPFFSYGGSSLMVFSAMIFILLKLDSERLDILR